MIGSKAPFPLPGSGHAKELRLGQRSTQPGAPWRAPCFSPWALNANRGVLISHRQHLANMRRMHELGPAHTSGQLSWRETLMRGGIETQLGTDSLNPNLHLHHLQAVASPLGMAVSSTRQSLALEKDLMPYADIL